MHESFVAVLSSGSCGNSTLVSSRESALLIDAGISCRELERRLETFGAEPSRVDAVLLTHEHTDHNRGARRFCRVHGVPMYGTSGTLALTPHEGTEAVEISAREVFSIGDITVRPFPVKHLAAEPVAFSLKIDDAKVSIASDLGCLTDRVVREMSESNLLMIEANHDVHLLENGNYPDFLKKAILSNHGHLSNENAGNLCARVVCDRLDEIILLHLSRDNNRSDLARDTVNTRLVEAAAKVRVTPTEYGSHNGPFRLG
ncbi:MAG: MBL fold metallo-hydrolase [Thermoplasmata archaeon]|nr:MBL fold metallo-hydrolase [Thermoplasmata archaeon]